MTDRMTLCPSGFEGPLSRRKANAAIAAIVITAARTHAILSRFLRRSVTGAATPACAPR